MYTKDVTAALHLAIDDACRAFNDGTFMPIMESDVCGFLYHRLLTNGLGASTVFQTSRVCGESERKLRPDIVVGSLQTPAACIEPVLIVEVKLFPRWGFSDQQMHRRFDRVLNNDIPGSVRFGGMEPVSPHFVKFTAYIATESMFWWGFGVRIHCFWAIPPNLTEPGILQVS